MAITPMDEFMCHQSVNTFDQLTTSDTQWTERVWLAAMSKSGKYVFGFGMGKYNNRNVMDASLCISVESKTQYNVNASRALFPDIDTYKVGPLGYTVPEPLNRVRVTCDDNEYGIKCDLTFIGETEIYEQSPSMFRRRRGRIINHMIRFFQTGSVEGWIEIEGERIEVKREEWWASRDRSWGIRSNTGETVTAQGVSSSLLGGLEPPGEGIPFTWTYFTMQFDTWNASFEFAQTPERKRLGPALGHLQHRPELNRKDQKIVDVEYDFDLNPASERIRSMDARVSLDDGSVLELHMDVLGMAYRRPGGGAYGGYKGWAQGLWMGELWVDGSKTDLTDFEACKELHFTDDYALRVTCGDQTGWGISEPIIPGIGELFVT